MAATQLGSHQLGEAVVKKPIYINTGFVRQYMHQTCLRGSRVR